MSKHKFLSFFLPLILATLVVIGISLFVISKNKRAVSICPPVAACDGREYTVFTYDADLGICTESNTSTYGEEPAWIKDKNTREKCEEKYQVDVSNIDPDLVCEMAIKKIPSSTYQFEEAVKSIKNRCYYNFALTKRGSSYCKKAAYPYTIDKCYSQLQ